MKCEGRDLGLGCGSAELLLSAQCSPSVLSCCREPWLGGSRCHCLRRSGFPLIFPLWFPSDFASHVLQIHMASCYPLDHVSIGWKLSTWAWVRERGSLWAASVLGVRKLTGSPSVVQGHCKCHGLQRYHETDFYLHEFCLFGFKTKIVKCKGSGNERDQRI